MRKSTMMIPLATTVLLLGLTPNPVLAQRGGGAGGAGQAETGQSVPRGDLDRTRDRLCDRDGTCDEDQDRDQDRDRDYTGDQDRDRDRDRDAAGDRDQDRDRLQISRTIDDQIVALSLLTGEERTRFRNEMRSATSAEERNRIRAEHRRRIEERAREMGIEPPPGDGAGLACQPRGGLMLMTMLSEQERTQFISRLRSARSAEERQRIRTEMHTTARERAREMGIEVPEWYGCGPAAR